MYSGCVEIGFLSFHCGLQLFYRRDPQIPGLLAPILSRLPLIGLIGDNRYKRS